MDLRSFFLDFYAEFKSTSLYTTMISCVENSPWHREENTAVHTDMVVAEYLSRTQDFDWSKDHLKGALACLFHDVGKPAAKVEHETPERGKHFRFLGHELVSARLFEDYAVRNWPRLSSVLDFQDIYAIGWIIQYHLPYRVKKADKVNALIVTKPVVLPENPEVFELVLLSDQYGRISDGHDEKKRDTEAWIAEFVAKEPMEIHKYSEDAPLLVMVIGSSSSGKSTFVNTINERYEREFEVFSWDTQRLEMFPHPDADNVTPAVSYNHSWSLACESSTFYSDSLSNFSNLTKKGVDIVVDNLNLSEKRRRQFAEVAANRGYRVKCILLPISMDKLETRVDSRNDRSISVDDVINMYMRLTYPSLSKYVHDVRVVGDNINALT